MRHRQGYSFVELLVVVLILVTLLGLAAGAFASFTSSSIAGVEAFMADAVRQARHTARTSAAPVALTIDAARREIRGSVREPLIAASFELDTRDDRIRPEGRTGRGFRIDAVTPAEPWRIPLADGDRPLPLIVPGQEADGLVLSCAVRAPRPARGNGILPLVAVCPDASLAYDRSRIGIGLGRLSTQRQAGGGGAPAITIATWQPVGWVRAGGKHHIIKPNPGQLSDNGLHQMGGVGSDLDRRLAGERWTELMVVHDGQYLRLYADGREIATPVLAGPLDPVLAEEGSGRFQVVVGALEFANRADAANGAIIDDVALWRIGNGAPTPLPPRVTPEADATILIHPDGRSETPDLIAFRYGDVDDANAPRAVVRIAADGSITSRIELPQPKPTPPPADAAPAADPPAPGAQP